MEIYILSDGEQVGPLSEAQVLDGLRSGMYAPEDNCWHEGMAEWRSIASVFSTRSANAPVPVHAASERSDKALGSGAKTSLAGSEIEPNRRKAVFFRRIIYTATLAAALIASGVFYLRYKNQSQPPTVTTDESTQIESTPTPSGAGNPLSGNTVGESHEKAFINSLGMKFVPIPGTETLFSVWDTRVRDYGSYAEANPGVDMSWNSAGFEQGEDHPVVNVSWEDAKAFCAWLTQKERKETKIGQDQEYRLPTDKEWSAAVGESKYPWGNQWPPPKGAGNYGPSLKVDDFENTSPVGSFRPNQYGLYDIGGNAWQWCEDWYRRDMNEQARLDKYPFLKNDGGGEKYHVVRGTSWYSGDDPDGLLSSARGPCPPGFRSYRIGFRCVLASEVKSPPER